MLITKETFEQLENEFISENPVTCLDAFNKGVKAMLKVLEQKIENEHYFAHLEMKDTNGVKLRPFDNVKVVITKGVMYHGEIVFYNNAFCIKHPDLNGNITHTPIVNYAPQVKIYKSENQLQPY